MVGKTDWFYEKKWGVMFHYIEHLVNREYLFTKGEEPAMWNDCIDNFDVKSFARSMHEINPGYVMFTITQGNQFFCAPNKAFDEISGYKPGEACSKRDLIMELCDELKKYDIDFMAYFTADGPYNDNQAREKFGYYREKQDVHTDFIMKWSEVIKEYSLRYGDKIKGWWFDGCQQTLGYDDEKMKYIADAARAGNPDTLIALNQGPSIIDFDNPEIADIIKGSDWNWEKIHRINAAADAGNEAAIKAQKDSLFNVKDVRWSKYEDYTSGEVSEMDQYPDGRFVDGSQWHILAGLGISTRKNSWYGRPTFSDTGCRYSAEYLHDYIKTVHEKGGVVSIGLYVARDGTLDYGQVEMLKKIKDLR